MFTDISEFLNIYLSVVDRIINYILKIGGCFMQHKCYFIFLIIHHLKNGYVINVTIPVEIF